MKWLPLFLLLVGCSNTHPNEFNLLVLGTHSVVKIETQKGLGTGVIIGPHYVLTARHVVGEVGETVKVNTQDKSFESKGTVIVSSENADIALVWVDKKSDHFLPIASRMPPELSTVHTIGFPLGGRLVVSDGRFQGYDDPKTFLVTTPIIFGNSGGPVVWFDPDKDQYEVIGIAVELHATHGLPVFHLARFRGVNVIEKFAHL